MRQHHDPEPYEQDEEDLEELGTPVYQGSGLSVRALTAEELNGSWTPTTTSPPSCWAAAGPPSTHQGTPSGVPRPLRPQRCRRRCPPRSLAASAAPAARP
jgi:hypothetical protein